MKFVITRTSSDDYIGVKNFSTIEELMHFMHTQKNPLIIGTNIAFNEDIKIVREYCSRGVNANEIVATQYSIEIYDDYREQKIRVGNYPFYLPAILTGQPSTSPLYHITTDFTSCQVLMSQL